MNIKKTTNNDLDATSLYIHIPFCNHVCSYCDFTKIFYNESLAIFYVLKLEEEIKHLIVLNKKFRTIYVGGGTPSCLSPYLLNSLFLFLSKVVDQTKNYEFSVEMNVESVNEDVLSILKKNKVNRISVGVQTFNDEVLKKLNRFHTGQDAINSINLVTKYFKNVSLDLIYGIPFSSFNNLKTDLNIISALNITHISPYALQINKNTALFNNKIMQLNQDELADQYDFIVEFLRKLGFKRYEVSNFSKKNYVSKHNIVYWRDKKYVALGAGASGYLGNRRYINTKNIIAYTFTDVEPKFETINKDDNLEYYLLTNLRLANGFAISEINNKFSMNFLETYKEKIKKLEKFNLIKVNKNRIKCTSHGLFLLDSIILELIK